MKTLLDSQLKTIGQADALNKKHREARDAGAEFVASLQKEAATFGQSTEATARYEAGVKKLTPEQRRHAGRDGRHREGYRCVQHHLDELARQFRWALTSREMFRWVQLQHPDTLTDIQRAARYYYLQKLCWGGKVSSRTFGTSPAAPPRLNLLRIEEDLSQAHLRLARVTVEHLAWQDCIARQDRPETLFFLGPPYWMTEGYTMAFGREQYNALADAMRRMKGRAIVTINNHPDMRATFKGVRVERVQIDYTLGGATR